MLNRSIQRVAARAFREREILLRSDDRVVALRLSPRRQKIAAGLAGTLLGVWVLVGSGLVWQHAVVDGQAARIAALQTETTQLRERLGALRQYSTDLATADTPGAPAPVAESRPGSSAPETGSAFDRIRLSLERLAAGRDRLAQRLAQSDSKRRSLESRLEDIQNRHAQTVDELAETRETLAAVSSGRETLGSRLAKTLADLQTARAKQAAAMQGRLHAEDKVTALRDTVQRLRTRKTHLEQRQARTGRDLDQMRARRDSLLAERRKLAHRVGRLETALGQVANKSQTDLIARIGNLEESLLAAERHSDAVEEARDSLRKRVAGLKEQMGELRSQQTALFQRYAEQARSSLDAIERTVAMTGLNVDRLLQRVGDSDRALGGPFVPFADAGGGLPAAARQFDRQMHRLRTLQVVLASLPLTAPVDNYWISSTFGKRRDPYNGRWAMHEGLDLAGQAGLSVMSAAPGRVVFAGYKGGYGKLVEVDHGFGITTRYGHLRQISVDRGETLSHRAELGELGNTGRSTGPHVHYEIRVDGEPVDPMNFLKAGKHVFKG